MNISLINGKTWHVYGLSTALIKVNGKKSIDFEKVEPDPMGISYLSIFKIW